MTEIEIQALQEKHCSSCKKIKPISEFYKHKKYGYRYECKPCSIDQKLKLNFGGLRRTVLERDGYKCRKCGITQEEYFKKSKKTLSIDHIDGYGSLSKIKNNKLSNLQTLCQTCHIAKDSRKKLLRYKGKLWSVVDLARAHNIKPTTLAYRLRSFWGLEEALTTPASASNTWHPRNKMISEPILKKTKWVDTREQAAIRYQQQGGIAYWKENKK